MNFSLRCHLCGTTFPATALWVCDQCLGPLEVTYDYAAIAPLVTRELIESRPKNLWRYRELLPIEHEPLTGLALRLHAARARRPARQAARRPRAVCEGRLGQPSDAVPTRTGSCRSRRPAPSSSGSRVFACASTGNLANSVAAHAARLGLACSVFIPDNLEPGKVTGAAVYQPAHHRRPRQLRRCEPAVHAGRGPVRLGLREHQPARLLRRRRQDLRLRDCRAARLALPAPRRLAGRRRHAAAAHPEGPSRSCARWAWSTGELPTIHAAQAAGCAPVVRALDAGPGVSRAGQAEHDRQVDRDRQPRRRLPGAALGPVAPAAPARW